MLIDDINRLIDERCKDESEKFLNRLRQELRHSFHYELRLDHDEQLKATVDGVEHSVCAMQWEAKKALAAEFQRRLKPAIERVIARQIVEGALAEVLNAWFPTESTERR
jgi:hypothetical protein